MTGRALGLEYKGPVPKELLTWALSGFCKHVIVKKKGRCSMCGEPRLTVRIVARDLCIPCLRRYTKRRGFQHVSSSPSVCILCRERIKADVFTFPLKEAQLINDELRIFFDLHRACLRRLLKEEVEPILWMMRT